MPKKKRKLSTYNLFVKRQVLAGKSFAQAAKAWKLGSKTTRQKIKTRAITKTRKRSGRVMTRKKTRSVRSRGLSLMKGLVPVRGIFASALIGVGASMIVSRFAPQMIPQQNLVIGGLVGGLPGAAAAYILQSGGLAGLGQGSTTAFF